MMKREDLGTEIDVRSDTQRLAMAQKSAEPVGFRVHVTKGGDAGAEIRVDPTRSAVAIGTSPTCQLILQDAVVERRHLTLEVVGNRLRVTDLGSSQGTLIQGLLVSQALLRGGELIEIGETTLAVECVPPSSTRLTTNVSFGRVIGASTARRADRAAAWRHAATMAPLLIEGEVGTGKELLAEEIHAASARQSGPFVVFAAASVSPANQQNALFGDGGALASAMRGTLLIEDVSGLLPGVQKHLLAAMDQNPDVRFIVTSRCDLDRAVDARWFHDDLLLRLAPGRIELPPLRSREGDATLLADYFCQRFGSEPLTDFMRRHAGYAWPGNVRELHDTVLQRLSLGDIEGVLGDEPRRSPPGALDWVLDQDLPFPRAASLVHSELEAAYAARELESNGNSVSRAAAASGLPRRSFAR